MDVYHERQERRSDSCSWGSEHHHEQEPASGSCGSEHHHEQEPASSSCGCHHQREQESVSNSCGCDHHQHSCLAIVPIFNHLDDQQMREISKTARTMNYRKTELIYQAGDRADSLYIVHRGKIKIYRLSESGKEHIYRVLTAGDFTGELALFNEGTHEAYAEALEDTEVCVITHGKLQKFLMQYPAIALKILSEISRRLDTAEVQTSRLVSEKADTRIALYLAECADANFGETEFTLPMSKKDLAAYLGTTPETISRKLTEFEEAGYIQQLAQRKIRIMDLDGLLMV